jgi:hypothetical protein
MKWLVLLVVAGGCRQILGIDELAGGNTDAPVGDGGDGGVADGPADASPPGPWAAPVPLGVTPVTGSDDDPTLTADLLEIYFNAADQIYVSRRPAIGLPWDAPSVVVELSSASPETTPEITADGLTIYFASSRSPTLGNHDIWVATRTDRALPWTAPVREVELCTTGRDTGATPTSDLLDLVIATEPAGSTDLYLASRASRGADWPPPVALANVNLTSLDQSAFLTDDRRELYFESNRDGGDFDIFVSVRASPDDEFPAALPVVELTTTMGDEEPWLSPDGRTMVFASDRGGTRQFWLTTR